MFYETENWIEPKDKIEYIDKSITCIRRFDNIKFNEFVLKEINNNK